MSVSKLDAKMACNIFLIPMFIIIQITISCRIISIVFRVLEDSGNVKLNTADMLKYKFMSIVLLSHSVYLHFVLFHCIKYVN